MGSFKDEAKNLKEEIGKLTDDFRKRADPSAQEFAELLQRIIDRTDVARTNTYLAPAPAASTESPEATSMQMFFDSVANSLLSTQRKLDLESQSYLASIASKPELQPAIFRIPRIQADLKFAVESVKGRVLNVIFFRQKQEERTLNEQSVSFELVAIPPPPEATGPAAGLPQLGIVYASGIRDELKAIVDKDPADTVKPLKEFWDQALVVAVGSATEFIVILSAGDDSEKDFGVWHIDVPTETVTVALSILRKPAPSETTGPIRKILADFGKRQASFLAQSGGGTS